MNNADRVFMCLEKDLRQLFKEELENYFSKSTLQKEETDTLWFPEAKALLRVTSGTLYQYFSRGMFPADVAWKSGKRILFSKSGLLRWLKSRNKDKGDGQD